MKLCFIIINFTQSLRILLIPVISRMSLNPLYKLGKVTNAGGREFTVKKNNKPVLNPFHAAAAAASAPTPPSPSAPAETPEPLPGASSGAGGYVTENPFRITVPTPIAAYKGVNMRELPNVNKGVNKTNPSIEKEKELFKFILKNQNDKILKLLREGVNINTTNFTNTPLIYAIIVTDSVYLIESLLANGADVKQKGYNNITPLIALCSTTYNGDYKKDIFDRLMDYITTNYEGQELSDIINYQPIYETNTRNGMNALMMACHHGFVHVVDRLIANGADVNLLEENVNESPLYIAVDEAINKKTENYKTVIESLLRAGADCSKGKSPLTLPVTAEIEELLSACGKSSAGGSSRKSRKNKNRKYKNRKNKSRRATRKNNRR